MFRSPLVDAIVVLVIVLLVLGPKRLPELGKGLGRGMREFKEGITGDSKSEDSEPSAIPAPAAETPPPASESQPSATGTETAPAPGRDSAEVGSEHRSAEVGSEHRS